eukprot:scaffold28336_cov69-Phaeocystis_antarctica.AAC.10
MRRARLSLARRNPSPRRRQQRCRWHCWLGSALDQLAHAPVARLPGLPATLRSNRRPPVARRAAMQSSGGAGPASAGGKRAAPKPAATCRASGPRAAACAARRPAAAATARPGLGLLTRPLRQRARPQRRARWQAARARHSAAPPSPARRERTRRSGLHLRGCQLVEELLPLELALPPRRERVLHEHLGLQRTLLQLLHRASRGALAAQALAIGSSEGRREPAHDPSQHATVARSAAHVERPFAGVPPAAGRSGPSAPPRGRACPPAPRAAWPAGLTRLGRRARFRASLGGPAARGRADSPARQLRPRHRAPAIRLASNRLDAVSWRRRTHCPRRRIRASPSRLRASRQRSGGPKEGLGSRELRCAMGVDVGVVVYGVSRGGGRAVASARARVCVQAATGSAGWHTIVELAWPREEELRGLLRSPCSSFV